MLSDLTPTNFDLLNGVDLGISVQSGIIFPPGAGGHFVACLINNPDYIVPLNIVNEYEVPDHRRVGFCFSKLDRPVFCGTSIESNNLRAASWLPAYSYEAKKNTQWPVMMSHLPYVFSNRAYGIHTNTVTVFQLNTPIEREIVSLLSYMKNGSFAEESTCLQILRMTKIALVNTGHAFDEPKVEYFLRTLFATDPVLAKSDLSFEFVIKSVVTGVELSLQAIYEYEYSQIIQHVADSEYIMHQWDTTTSFLLPDASKYADTLQKVSYYSLFLDLVLDTVIHHRKITKRDITAAYNYSMTNLSMINCKLLSLGLAPMLAKINTEIDYLKDSYQLALARIK